MWENIVWVVFFGVPLAVGGVAMSLTPPEYMITRIGFSISATALLARLGWWMATEHHFQNKFSMLVFAFGIFGVIGLTWASGMWWIGERERERVQQEALRQPPTQKTAVSPIQKEGKLIEDRFTLSIVVDKNTALPIYEDLPYDSSDRMTFLHNITHRAKYKTEDWMDHKNVSMPRQVAFASRRERTEFYEELIQYELVTWLHMILIRKGLIYSAVDHGQATAGSKVYETFRPKNYSKIPGSEIAAKLSNNRFFNQGTDGQFWNDSQVWLPVPVGTNLSIPDKRSVILEKPNYYAVSIAVEPFGAGNGAPPYLLNVIKQANVETDFFIVNLKAT